MLWIQSLTLCARLLPAFPICTASLVSFPWSTDFSFLVTLTFFTCFSSSFSSDSAASSLTPCSSLPPSASPTLTEAFGLATPPLGGGYSLGSSSCGGSSRSPSPLSLLQAAAASSGKPFAGKPVELWSKGDVADWLDSLNLAEHRHAFLDNEIEGAHLASLRKEDLIDLGVTRVGHRMNIERALKGLTDR